MATIELQQRALIAFIRGWGVTDVKWYLRARNARSTRRLLEIMEDLCFEEPGFTTEYIDEESGSGMSLCCGEAKLSLYFRGGVEVY